MARNLSAAIQAALNQPTVRMILACELDTVLYDVTTSSYVQQWIRFTDAPMDVTLAGNVFSGFGQFASISTVDESNSMQASGISIVLNGLDPTTLPDAITGRYQGRNASVFVCFLDASYALTDYYVLGRWPIDVMDVRTGVESSITVKCESLFVDWQRPRTRYFADADHQSRTVVSGNTSSTPNTSDTFFKQFPTFYDKTILWGRTK